MSESTTKVLMFGWEFPPLMAGGLGIACQELVNALSKRHSKIHLVLPRVTGEEKAPNINIYSAEEWEESLIRKIKQKQAKDAVDLGSNSKRLISAYESASSPIDLSILSKEALYEITNSQNLQKCSTKDAINLYGYNLMDEVFKYNQIAGSISVNLDFDVIHCHDWLTIGAGIIAKQKTGKPLIIHIHCTEFDRSPGYGNNDIHQLERAGCEYADKIIAVSNWTKKILIEKYSIPHSKIEVVHNGINQTSEYPQPNQFRRTHPKVLFLGRVTYQKGPNYFLEAAAKVLTIRSDIEFIVAGKGDMLDYLRGRAIELGIQNNIKFLGAISSDKVADIYREVDCFVLSSVSEPFGLTVLEALSQRLPVIVSKQSGVSEVLRHILRYDYWDVDYLASLILSVLTYEPLSSELKERAIDDLQPINWDQSAQKVENIYNRLLK